VWDRMTEVICRHCKYLWDYSGNMYYAQCPRCRRLNKLNDAKEGGNENDNNTG